MLSEAVRHGRGKLDALVNNAANMYRQPVDGFPRRSKGRLPPMWYPP